MGERGIRLDSIHQEKSAIDAVAEYNKGTNLW